MTDYCIDSVAGSDSNNGLTTSTAWRSLAKAWSFPVVPGDKIHFGDGSSWTGAFFPLASSVYDSYATGRKGYPTIGGVATPIIMNRTIKGGWTAVGGLSFTSLCFKGTTNFDAIEWGAGADDCIFDGCVFDTSGSNPGNTANRFFYGSGSKNLTLMKCVFQNVLGDNFYGENLIGVRILGCTLHTPQGSVADGIQIGSTGTGGLLNSADIQIVGNTINMREVPSTSGKGGIVLENIYATGALVIDGAPCGALIDGNTIAGLNYCAGINGDDAVVRNNICSEATLNSYSWGLGASTAHDSHRHHYYGNKITGCNRGLLASGPSGGPYNRVDFRMDGNEIDSCPEGLRIDQPISGYATGNTFNQCAAPISQVGLGLNVAPGGQYTTWTDTPNTINP